MSVKKWLFFFSLLTIFIIALIAPIAYASGWTIMMWHGDLGDLAAGWQLCDGTNGSPDLRNQFTVGAGDTYDLADTGGANTNDLQHSHTVTHTHELDWMGGAKHIHDLAAHYHAFDTNIAGAHTHTVAGADLSHYHTLAEHSTYYENQVNGVRIGYNVGYSGLRTQGGGGGTYTFYQVKNYTDNALTDDVTTSSDGAHSHSGETGFGRVWNLDPPYYDDFDETAWPRAVTPTPETPQTEEAAPETDLQLSSAVENRPPYYAVYYICYPGLITGTTPITTAIMVTDPNTTQYYTTTYGSKFAVYRTVTTGEQTIGYAVIALCLICVLQLVFTVVTEGKRKWN